MRATQSLLSWLQRKYRIGRFSFAHLLLKEPTVARRKHISAEMNLDWGDGNDRIWSPPFDLLPIVVRKRDSEVGTRGNGGYTVANPGLVRALARLELPSGPLDPVMTSGAPDITKKRRGNPELR